MRRRLLSGALVVVVLAGLGYIGFARYATPSAPAQEPAPSQAASTTRPQHSGGSIFATGVVVPAHYVELGFRTGGVLAELSVSEGERIEAGQVLARLNPTDAELTVAEAEAALQVAEAQLDLLRAPLSPEALALAEAQLEAARTAVAQAAAQRDQVMAGASPAEIAAAEAQLAAAQAEQLAAREAHDQTMKCYKMPDGGEVCPALGTLEEQARYAFHAANEALAAAQVRLDQLHAGATESEVRAAQAAVWAASAQRDVVQAQINLEQAGASSEQISVAQAQVRQAQVVLERAQAALEETMLVAPFAGTIVEVRVEEGEVVGMGTPVVVLADLSRWQIEADDVKETDIGRVVVGQEVAVTVDAFPDSTFQGQVVGIALVPTVQHGDVVYVVTVSLDGEADIALRWGMTARLEIPTRPP